MAALDSLLKQYKLKREDVSKKISDMHLDKISHSCCSQWRRLPPYFDMEKIVKDDINRLSGNEDEKRSSFFSKWVDEKGSDATYEKLISALLEVGCKNDAEKVCKLMQPVPSASPKLSQSPESLPELPELPQLIPDRKSEHEPDGPQILQPASDHVSPSGKYMSKVKSRVRG